MFTAEDFTRKGFFPESIIPIFCSYTLANALHTIEKNDLQSKDFESTSKCCSHSVPKIKNIRRHVSIPNPLHQIILYRILEDNWSQIDQFISNSNISESSPALKKNSKTNRSFDWITDINEKKFLIAEKAIDARFTLITDISRYYPTIYTHVIPWALHGKEIAKTRKNDMTLLGNQIDKSLRNTQDGQTLGIPIGPDSSRIVAEIIGVAIDIELSNEIKELNGFRFVDDFNLFFHSRGEAELALHKIHTVLKKFELEVNPTKTKIIQFPYPLESEWVSELRSFNFRKGKKIGMSQRGDILNYFSRAFNYSNKFPDENVLKYAIKRIREITIINKNWSLFESLLLKSIIAESTCLPTVINILNHYKKLDYKLNNEKISQAITELINYHSKFSHGYEITWALWLAKTLKISINHICYDSLSKCEDPLVALISLDLIQEGLIDGDFERKIWYSFMNSNELYDAHWILAYEAYIKDWLPSFDGSKYIENDGFFSILEQEKVEFYNPKIHEVDYVLKGAPIEEQY